MLNRRELEERLKARITGRLSPEEIADIKVSRMKRFDAKCPYCGASMKEFGIQIKGDLFYCKKCLKYHTL